MNISELRKAEIRKAMARKTEKSQQQASYESLSASELYCGNCKRSMPVREKRLLVLSGGDLFDYQCSGCGESLGTKRG